MPPPTQLAAGSAKSPSPFASPFGSDAPTPNLTGRRESSAIERLVSMPAPPPTDDVPFNPMATFGASVTGSGQKKSNAAVFAAIGGAVVLLGGGFLVYKLATGSGESASTSKGSGSAISGSAGSSSGSAVASGGSAAGSQIASGTAGSAVASGAVTGSGASASSTGPALDAKQLAATGFDLYVTPNTITGWRIDNQVNTSRLPAQIRSVQPGTHTITIDAPPGYMSATQVVDVEAGKAGRVEITLTPIDITGVFETTPPGARVYLVVNGQRVSVGQTPTKYKLNPTMTYQVIIEKDGYVSVSRPLSISGNPEEKVEVTLEKAQVAIHHPSGGGTPPGGGTDHGGGTPPGGGSGTPPGGGTDHGGGTPPGGGNDHGGGTPPGGGNDHGGGTPPGGGNDTAGGDGILSLGSKPPCDIYIDGKSTGLKTPQREIKLSVGHHKVTLMNNEYGIKESFGVDIKAGTPTKTVKDFSDRIPQ